MPPGWTSTNAAEIVFAAGNTLVSVIRTVPLLVLVGCCASILWLRPGDTATAPAILSDSSGPGTGAAKITSSLGSGTWAKDEPETPKFLDSSTSFSVCLNQSLSRKVLSSSNSPSSNTSRNSQPSGLRPRIECGTPDAKYQRSPTPTSSTKLCP